jgi:hypothetical protein
MIDIVFVAALATVLTAILAWGIRTLPAERWQMIAAVPLSKNGDGEWRSLNLTYYGFFSATASTFGAAMGIVLLSSVGTPLPVIAGLLVAVLAICLPASRLVAWLIEGKRNTFTIAGPAFLGAVILPPGLWLMQRALLSWFDVHIWMLPILAAVAVVYALSEALGRMACLSFGCCYGKPLRETSPRVGRVFVHFPTVFHGVTKKAAYASDLAEEPLIPVQAVTAIIFTLTGLIGLAFFLAGFWRLAGIVPALGAWGWRAVSENLRADYRGEQRTSAYQIMAVIAMAYTAIALLVIPNDGPLPNLAAGLTQVASASVILSLQALWVVLFLYYGRSRVTGSVVSFHVVTERV